MAGSDKERFGGAALATGISFIAISISIACLVHVFFLASPNAQCSCPQNGKPDESQNTTAEIAKRKTIQAATKEKIRIKMREDADTTLGQTIGERNVRKRRQSSNQGQQVNGNTAFGGYLHNAILRLQQQMITVEGRYL